jgi:hypothetical protein
MQDPTNELPPAGFVDAMTEVMLSILNLPKPVKARSRLYSLSDLPRSSAADLPRCTG